MPVGQNFAQSFPCQEGWGLPISLRLDGRVIMAPL